MKKIGCTTPFGSNSTNVCRDKIRGKKALELFKNVKKSNMDFVKECFFPCTNIKIKGLGNVQNDLVKVTFSRLEFEQFIKVSTSFVTYTALELVAEVGGYVGLFLGISVFHLSDAIGWIIKLFFRQ